MVSAIALQAVTWAVIALARNLLISRLNSPRSAVALQIAVVVIGLPIFLFHWLSIQRRGAAQTDEGECTLRYLYLHGMMAAFLGPFAARAFDLLGIVLGADSVLVRQDPGLGWGDTIFYHLLAMIVLGVLWESHRRIASAPGAVGVSGGAAAVRRAYVLGFSGAGLAMTVLGIVNVMRVVLSHFGAGLIRGDALGSLAAEVARLIVGLPLWVIFWRWAQRMFEGPSKAEHTTVLRKLYLYGVVLVCVVMAVSNASIIVADQIRRMLGLPVEGDMRLALPIILACGMAWALHAHVLAGDAQAATEVPRQAAVRRLYLYLVAAVGLTALLVGLTGDTSVLIRSLDAGFGTELRQQLAWFTAAIVSGLPVWVVPWRSVQLQALERDDAGEADRSSVVRKVYLYVFLFAATMAVLSGAVFIVYKLLSWVLGLEPPTLSELGQAIAFSVIAVGVWLFHGAMLRRDQELSGEAQARRLRDLRVAIVDVGDGQFGRAVAERLERESRMPGLEPVVLILAAGDATDGKGAERDKEIADQLASARLIVGPWTIAVASEEVPGQVAEVVRNSTGRKLLVPTRGDGWEWAGVDPWDQDDLVGHAARAILQLASGADVKPVRPLGAGAVIGIALGVLLLIVMLAIPLVELFEI
jgi:hypothetical protein